MADTLVLESMFGAPPIRRIAVIAEQAARRRPRLNGGANAATICAAMTLRGIVATCDLLPRGERTI